MSQYLQINRWGEGPDDLWEDLTPARWWTANGSYMGSNACNLLAGSDGQAFPPDVTDDKRYYIFATDICRSLYAEYDSEIDIDGINALRYTVPAKAFQVNTTENIGFCMEHEKLKDIPWDECLIATGEPDILSLDNCTEHFGDIDCYDGIMDISKCMKRASVVISNPHFYQVQ